MCVFVSVSRSNHHAASCLTVDCCRWLLSVGCLRYVAGCRHEWACPQACAFTLSLISVEVTHPVLTCARCAGRGMPRTCFDWANRKAKPAHLLRNTMAFNLLSSTLTSQCHKQSTSTSCADSRASLRANFPIIECGSSLTLGKPRLLLLSRLISLPVTGQTICIANRLFSNTSSTKLFGSPPSYRTMFDAPASARMTRCRDTQMRADALCYPYLGTTK